MSDFRGSSRRMSAAQASSAITRNTAWNLFGTGLPILLTLITIPVLVGSIGVDRFGVLTIAWVLLGYFGLFDLGLGRATIRFLAEAFEHNRIAEGRTLFWTSLILSGVLGLVGAFILTALTPLLVSRVLNIPTEIQPEALGAFYLMAWSVPLVVLTAVLRGSLESQHRFGLMNIIQVPTSALTQIAPLLALLFSHDLTWLVGAMVFSRLLGTVVFLAAALRHLESPFEGPFFLGKSLRALFSYGGWLTVTNIVGPLTVYTDRFVIGSLSSMAAVAYYATPYDLITRLGILPQSLSRTVFPIFSAEAEAQQRTRLYINAIKHLTLLLAPIVATVTVFAPELLRLWIGETFAENSTSVLQILAVGVLVNSLAMVPFTLIQGLGRPDVTAKFHLLELPFYLLLLWYSVQYWGVVGAATSWTVRVGVDALLLVLYVRLTSRVSYREAGAQLHRTLALAACLILGSWLLYELVTNSMLKMVVWGLILGVVVFGAWQRLLTSGEREKLASYSRRIWLGRSRGADARAKKTDR